MEPAGLARIERLLAAILAANIAGYSRLMGADEGGNARTLQGPASRASRSEDGERHGRIVKTASDGILVEFASIVDAVRCAVEVQQAMAERKPGVGADNRIELRISVNLGDVIVEGDDLYGDSVNIGAQVEPLAAPGGVSNTVHDHPRDWPKPLRTCCRCVGLTGAPPHEGQRGLGLTVDRFPLRGTMPGHRRGSPCDCLSE
jgi:adenylate cyclase